jgi:hypothetical protein
MSEKLSPVEQKRNEVYNAMNPDLQKVAKKLDGFAAQVAKGLLKAQWTIGEWVKKVIAEEATYGSKAVEQLAAYHDVSPTTLYDARTLCVEFTKERVAELTEKPMANGQYISYSHCRSMMRVKSSKQREKLWKRVFAEGMSVRRLDELIEDAGEKNQTNRGGSAPAKPKSVMAGSQQIIKETGTLNNRFEGWGEVVFDEVDHRSPSEVNQELLDRLTQARDNLDLLQKNSGDALGRLNENITRVEKILSTRADAAETDTSGDEDAHKANKKKATKKKAAAKKSSKKKAPAKKKASKKKASGDSAARASKRPKRTT